MVDCFLNEQTTRAIRDLAEPLFSTERGRRPGIRRVFARQPDIAAIVSESPVAELMHTLGGDACRVVRAVLFDKSPETNWMVPWHQDATIALSERLDVPGFGPWAIKDGEHHCQPPPEVLNSIFTLRIHLDPCPAECGPLRVVERSQNLGLLSQSGINEVVARGNIHEAVTDLGGLVLTTPLAVHGSARVTALATRRRVLHLDCSAYQLSGGLRWAEAHDI